MIKSDWADTASLSKNIIIYEKDSTEKFLLSELAEIGMI